MEYKTVKLEATDEFTEKRSRFLCHVKPVKTPDEAIAFINEKKAKYWDATHNVYAYILRDNNIMRYSDDGEPQGTAGMPALEVLRKMELFDVAVVITRYFGGIMLGAGGLVRAYAKGAKVAADAGKIATMSLCSQYEMTIDYAKYERIKTLLGDFFAQITDTQYADNITISFFIKKTDAQAFLAALTEQTNGGIEPKCTGEVFMPV